MGYRYLHDFATGDAAFAAWGATPEEMVLAAGDATMRVMVADLATIGMTTTRPLALEESELDLLLWQALETLIFWKDAERLLLRFTRVAIGRSPGGFRLRGEARGEPIDPGRHQLLADVKAVTLYRLQVVKKRGQWRATVVLDL